MGLPALVRWIRHIPMATMIEIRPLPVSPQGLSTSGIGPFLPRIVRLQQVDESKREADRRERFGQCDLAASGGVDRRPWAVAVSDHRPVRAASGPTLQARMTMFGTGCTRHPPHNS